MSGPKIQNFSLAAGDSFVINFDVGPDEGATLANCDIYWQAFRQEHGVVVEGVEPVIAKSIVDSVEDGIHIVSEPQLTFTVTLDEADTISLLRNYYHEITIIDDEGNRTTPTVGIMTVTQTENRNG